MSDVAEKIAELETAKDAVQTMLDRPGVSVGMHGIAYWAGRVDALREEIRELL